MARWDRHEFTAVAGTRMHAACLGPAEAPSVVCVHGLGCSYRYFQPLAKELAPAFQTVAVDLPGFGRTRGPSQALDVRELALALAQWLRATGRAGATLVGDSTGCQSIVDLAVTAPDVLGPVVLAGPTFDQRARTLPRQALRLLVNGVVDTTGPSLVPIRLRDRYDSGIRRWLDTFLLALHDPIERKIGKVVTPAMVVRGSRDPLVPPAWATELADLLPQGRLVTVPSAGHTVNYAKPRAVAMRVREVAAGGRRERAAGPRHSDSVGVP